MNEANVTTPGSAATGPSQAFEVGGADASSLYRAAVAAVLEALYGTPDSPQAEAGSGVLPLQAAGRDESERLRALLEELLREAPSVAGRLLPPSWVSFDEKRATATLRLAPEGRPARRLRLGAVKVGAAAGGGLTATLTVVPVS